MPDRIWYHEGFPLFESGGDFATGAKEAHETEPLLGESADASRRARERALERLRKSFAVLSQPGSGAWRLELVIATELEARNDGVGCEDPIVTGIIEPTGARTTARAS